MTNHQEHTTISSLAGSTNTDDAPASLPLGIGDAPDETGLDPVITTGSGGRKFSAGSLLLVAVVAVACGGIWFMKTLSRVTAASGTNPEVESSIENFIKGLDQSGRKAGSAALAGDQASVLAVLSGSYTERQVPLDNVQRNPFIIYGDTAVQGTDGSLSRRQSERRAAFESAAARLDLKSVIMGSQPLANVSGRIVRRGDEIISDGVALKVTGIAPDQVTLTAEDADLQLHTTFTLTIKR